MKLLQAHTCPYLCWWNQTPDVLYINIYPYHVNVMIVSAMQKKTDATNDNAGSVLLPLPPWDEMKRVADVLWSDSGFHSPLNLNYHIHQRLSWNTCQRWSVSWPPTFHLASAVGSPHLCKSLPAQPWVYNNKNHQNSPSCASETRAALKGPVHGSVFFCECFLNVMRKLEDP